MQRRVFFKSLQSWGPSTGAVDGDEIDGEVPLCELIEDLVADGKQPAASTRAASNSESDARRLGRAPSAAARGEAFASHVALEGAVTVRYSHSSRDPDDHVPTVRGAPQRSAIQFKIGADHWMPVRATFPLVAPHQNESSDAPAESPAQPLMRVRAVLREAASRGERHGTFGQRLRGVVGAYATALAAHLPNLQLPGADDEGESTPPLQRSRLNPYAFTYAPTGIAGDHGGTADDAGYGASRGRRSWRYENMRSGTMRRAVSMQDKEAIAAPSFEWFVGRVAVEDGVHNGDGVAVAPVIASVLVDGREVWSSPPMSTSGESYFARCCVAGGRSLTLAARLVDATLEPSDKMVAAPVLWTRASVIGARNWSWIAHFGRRHDAAHDQPTATPSDSSSMTPVRTHRGECQHGGLPSYATDGACLTLAANLLSRVAFVSAAHCEQIRRGRVALRRVCAALSIDPCAVMTTPDSNFQKTEFSRGVASTSAAAVYAAAQATVAARRNTAPRVNAANSAPAIGVPPTAHPVVVLATAQTVPSTQSVPSISQTPVGSSAAAADAGTRGDGTSGGVSCATPSSLREADVHALRALLRTRVPFAVDATDDGIQGVLAMLTGVITAAVPRVVALVHAQDIEARVHSEEGRLLAPTARSAPSWVDIAVDALALARAHLDVLSIGGIALDFLDLQANSNGHTGSTVTGTLAELRGLLEHIVAGGGAAGVPTDLSTSAAARADEIAGSQSSIVYAFPFVMRSAAAAAIDAGLAVFYPPSEARRRLLQPLVHDGAVVEVRFNFARGQDYAKLHRALLLLQLECRTAGWPVVLRAHNHVAASLDRSNCNDDDDNSRAVAELELALVISVPPASNAAVLATGVAVLEKGFARAFRRAGLGMWSVPLGGHSVPLRIERLAVRSKGRHSQASTRGGADAGDNEYGDDNVGAVCIYARTAGSFQDVVASYGSGRVIDTAAAAALLVPTPPAEDPKLWRWGSAMPSFAELAR